ncbi:hypothetical protein BGZ97_003948 [Linnemannia gamsii]|uniref:Uncharacterized protein n=1 Tax=Linnemannia gamsii TaxID=64522 RepID=A0A9P6RI73_9FUNG|nr:hypothetical protein BGZ97_003948 [Linnemannia gamsii]
MKPATIAIALTAIACVSARAITNYAAFESDNMDLMTRSLTKRDEAQDKAEILNCFKGASDILLQASPSLPEDDPANAKVCQETATVLKAKLLEMYNSIADTYALPEADRTSDRSKLMADLQENELTQGDLTKIDEIIKSD